MGLAAIGGSAIGGQILGGIIGGVGAEQEGQSEQRAAQYNAQIQRSNALQAEQNAQISEQTGEAQMGIEGLKERGAIGEETAREGASGVDSQSGSNLDVRSSMRELGEMDAMNIRTQAAKEAYGYRVQATNAEAQGELDEYEGKAASKAAQIKAASTFLGSAGSAASTFGQFKLAGAFA